MASKKASKSSRSCCKFSSKLSWTGGKEERAKWKSSRRHYTSRFRDTQSPLSFCVYIHRMQIWRTTRHTGDVKETRANVWRRGLKWWRGSPWAVHAVLGWFHTRKLRGQFPIRPEAPATHDRQIRNSRTYDHTSVYSVCLLSGITCKCISAPDAVWDSWGRLSSELVPLSSSSKAKGSFCWSTSRKATVSPRCNHRCLRRLQCTKDAFSPKPPINCAEDIHDGIRGQALSTSSADKEGHGPVLEHRVQTDDWRRLCFVQSLFLHCHRSSALCTSRCTRRESIKMAQALPNRGRPQYSSKVRPVLYCIASSSPGKGWCFHKCL